MPPLAILLFIVMALPDRKEPIVFEWPMASVSDCLYEQHELLVRAPHTVLITGGELQVACVVTHAKSEEH